MLECFSKGIHYVTEIAAPPTAVTLAGATYPGLLFASLMMGVRILDKH